MIQGHYLDCFMQCRIYLTLMIITNDIYLTTYKYVFQRFVHLNKKLMFELWNRDIYHIDSNSNFIWLTNFSEMSEIKLDHRHYNLARPYFFLTSRELWHFKYKKKPRTQHFLCLSKRDMKRISLLLLANDFIWCHYLKEELMRIYPFYSSFDTNRNVLFIFEFSIRRECK